MQIARLLSLQERLDDISIQELSGLWAAIPNDAIDGTPGLFDSLFNPTQLASLGTPIAYVETTTATFLHPSWNTGAGAPGTSNPRDNTLAPPLTGLRISDQELVQLLTNLAAPLGITLTAQPVRTRSLCPSEISARRPPRHAGASARPVHLQLFQLITAANVPVDLLAPPPIQPTPPAAPTVVHVIDTLAALLDARDWTSASGFSGDEMAFVTGRIPLDASLLPDAPTIATATVAQLQSDHALSLPTRS